MAAGPMQREGGNPGATMVGELGFHGPRICNQERNIMDQEFGEFAFHEGNKEGEEEEGMKVKKEDSDDPDLRGARMRASGDRSEKKTQATRVIEG